MGETKKGEVVERGVRRRRKEGRKGEEKRE